MPPIKWIQIFDRALWISIAVIVWGLGLFAVCFHFDLMVSGLPSLYRTPH